jgi:CBS domain-containing protein
MRVKDIMSQPAVTSPVSATLDAVARQMWDHDFGMIPLVDAESRVVGVITDRDICMAAYTQGRPIAEIAASSAMASEVACVHPDDSVNEVESLMSAKQVRRVPVVDRTGRAIGVLSVSDLARMTARVTSNGAEHEFVETLAAISKPRNGAAGVSRA